MLDENCSKCSAFAQSFLGLPGLGDVLDGAGHSHRAPLSVELQPSHAVHPAHRPVGPANNPIFSVERLALAEYLILEITQHRRPIVGMDQGGPSIDGPFELLIDSEDLVHDIGTGPCSRIDIQRIAAQSADPLRLPKRLLALAERSIRALAFGNVLSCAAEEFRLSALIEFHPSQAVYPSHLTIGVAKNAILSIERRSLAQNLFREIGGQPLAIAGMDQRKPSLVRALEFIVDSKQLVQHRRARPTSGADLHAITAQPRNPLRLLERFLVLAQRCFRALALGDVLGEDDESSHLAVGAEPRTNLAVHSLHAAVLPRKAIFGGQHNIALECTEVLLPPVRGNFRKDFVVGSPDQIAPNEIVDL